MNHEEKFKKEDTIGEEGESFDEQEGLKQEKPGTRDTEFGRESQKKEQGNSFHSFMDGVKQDEDLQDILKNISKYRSNLVINNYGIIAGDEADIQDIHIGKKSKNKKSKKEALTKPEQLEIWIAEHYNQFDNALLIACAVFHDMPYTWINEASEKLYVLFDDSKVENMGKIARSHSVKMFGAEIHPGELNTYTGKVEVECICFSKSEQIGNILRTVWNEFPKMRKVLVLWLKKYIFGERKIMSERARDILGYLAGLDYYYFLNGMMKWIIKEKSIYDDLVLVQIIAVLYQQEKFKNNLDNMIKSWSRQKNVQNLLLAMLVCVLVENNSEYLRSALKIYMNEVFIAIQKGQSNEYTRKLLVFFAAGMRRVIFYRLLVEELYEMARRKKSRQERGDICYLFLELFSKDVLLSCYELKIEEEPVLIKLVLTHNSFWDKLCFLWNMIWKEYNFRMIGYDMLSQYYVFIRDKEERKMQIEAFVKAVFNKNYNQDICQDIMRKIEMRCKKL